MFRTNNGGWTKNSIYVQYHEVWIGYRELGFYLNISKQRCRRCEQTYWGPNKSVCIDFIRPLYFSIWSGPNFRLHCRCSFVRAFSSLVWTFDIGCMYNRVVSLISFIVVKPIELFRVPSYSEFPFGFCRGPPSYWRVSILHNLSDFVRELDHLLRILV